MSIEKDQVQLLIDECRHGVSGKGPAIEVANDLLDSCCDNLDALLAERDQLKTELKKLLSRDALHVQQFNDLSDFRRRTVGGFDLKVSGLEKERDQFKAEVEKLRSILPEARSMLNTVSECSSNECEDCREHAGLHRDGIDLVIGKSGES